LQWRSFSSLLRIEVGWGSRLFQAEDSIQSPVLTDDEGWGTRSGKAGAQAVKLEGGMEMLPQVEKLASSGIPAMAHIGFTPQLEHQLGGCRVQGSGEDAQRLIDIAKAFEAAGAFAILIEMVPGDVERAITEAVSIPTVGIGAGNQCDAQVLVWQD
jgi:3-methyl-2-oxobutanoate hydroxymethyltransferase